MYLIVWNSVYAAALGGVIGQSHQQETVWFPAWFPQTDYISHPAPGHLEVSIPSPAETRDSATWMRPKSAEAPAAWERRLIQVAGLADPGTAEPPARSTS